MPPERMSIRSDPGTEPSAPDDEPRLSVAATARRLGIAPATLRTWDRRYGIGPGEHLPGRHRRYTADDVARLELMQHALVRGANPADAARYALTATLPRPGADPPYRPRAVPSAGGPSDPAVAPVEDGDPVLAEVDGVGEVAARVRVGGRVLRLPGAGRRARGLGRAALAMDASAVRRLLRESIAADGLQVTWDEVVRPVLVAVAQRWASTGAGVEIEHLVSECVITTFGAYPDTAAVPGRARAVLLAGMPGERHTLPLVVLAAVLAARGVPCRWLGSDLPAEALVAAVRRTAPAVVVLWSQLPATADLDVLRALPRTRPRFRTFVAGPGWGGVDLPSRMLCLGSLSQACTVVGEAVRV